MGQAQFRRLFAGSHSHNNFAKFQDLPCELRLQIWELSLPGPRLVQVRHYWYGNNQKSYYFTSVCAPPIHLQVCRDSRAVALQHYIFCDDDGAVHRFRDPAIDILYFGAGWYYRYDLVNFINVASKKDWACLDNLAVNEVHSLPDWKHRPSAASSAPDGRPTLVSSFKGLKKLIMSPSADIYGDLDARLRSGGCNGRLFGGGNPTDEEMKASRHQHQWIFADFSIHGQRYYTWKAFPGKVLS